MSKINSKAPVQKSRQASANRPSSSTAPASKRTAAPQTNKSDKPAENKKSQSAEKGKGTEKARDCDKSKETDKAHDCDKGKEADKGCDKDKKDSCDISDEAKCCDDKREKFNELIDGLKDLFEDLFDDQGGCCDGGKDQGGNTGPCQGGGDQGPGQVGEGGGCGGGKGAGGAEEAGDCGGSKDPVAKLEQALEAVHNAKCPKKKQKALDELRKAYEEVEQKGVELDPKLKLMVNITLSLGVGSDDGMFRSPAPGQGGRSAQPAGGARAAARPGRAA